MKVTNRFKGLDLIDRVLAELWTEVCSIVQEAMIKTIPKKKQCKKSECLSKEALQIADKTKRSERQGRKRSQLNAEIQRIKRRDKKACLKEQCKKIEEEMGSLQENWSYQGNISCKNGHNKGQKW